MSATTLKWTAATCIALMLSSAYLLDGPSEIEAAQDVAADLQDAIKSVATDAQLTGTRGQNNHNIIVAAVQP